mmetsp:Transcript_60336/g.165743  ORF Transcript_60336/g.165743 Transcript_60336/m.165743 type:complete len:352 (+) Transcript_60336:376-1431(+)
MFYQKWYIYCFSNEEVEAPSFRKDTIADAPSFRKGTVADARVSPEAATSASGGGGVSSLAPWAFEEEDAAMLKLRVRFCQDTLISTQMTEAVSILGCVAMVLLFRDSDGAPNMSFAMPGVPPITTETILVNLTFMLFGEMIMSDALVVILSRTDYVSDTKVDLPWSAWRERARDAYLALYACLALLTVFGVTQCVVEMCYTSLGDFGDGNNFGDYTISRHPRKVWAFPEHIERAVVESERRALVLLIATAVLMHVRASSAHSGWPLSERACYVPRWWSCSLSKRRPRARDAGARVGRSRQGGWKPTGVPRLFSTAFRDPRRIGPRARRIRRSERAWPAGFARPFGEAHHAT